METLPTSELVAYTEQKGKNTSLCLSKNSKNDKTLIDEQTLFFVSIHELSHICTLENVPSHGEQFWSNFNFLLHNAKNSGLYHPINYKQNPQLYCGMEINTNPYFDMMK